VAPAQRGIKLSGILQSLNLANPYVAAALQVFCGQADWYVNGVPRAVLSLPAPPCPGCAALAGLGALLVQDFVNNVALLGGPYDCSYSVDYARLCP